MGQQSGSDSRSSGLNSDGPAGHETRGRVTETELRAGAFANLGLSLSKVADLAIDLDAGSMIYDPVSNQKFVSTGATVGVGFLGFGIELSIFNRRIPVGDQAPGSLWREPYEHSLNVSFPWETGTDSKARLKGVGGSIGLGVGGKAGYDILDHAISPAY